MILRELKKKKIIVTDEIGSLDKFRQDSLHMKALQILKLDEYIKLINLSRIRQLMQLKDVIKFDKIGNFNKVCNLDKERRLVSLD